MMTKDATSIHVESRYTWNLDTQANYKGPSLEPPTRGISIQMESRHTNTHIMTKDGILHGGHMHLLLLYFGGRTHLFFLCFEVTLYTRRKARDRRGCDEIFDRLEPALDLDLCVFVCVCVCVCV
jgi:hypothetical protein